MESIVLIIHLVLALALVAVILMQRAEGGAAALTGGDSGMGGFMTARGAGNFLTRTTMWLAGAFIFTSLILTAIASDGGVSESIMDQQIEEEQAPVESEAPSVPFSE